MPSPVGHALAGIAAGVLVVGRPRTPHAGRLLALLQSTVLSPEVWLFGALGILPDIDFLFGIHSMYTHSIGAVAIVALAGSRWPGPSADTMRIRRGAAMAAAYGSHVLLDWLGSDDTAPLGIMALWPVSSAFFLSDRRWFPSVCRQYDEISCWLHNTQGVLWEVAVLTPLVVGAVWLARRR